MNNYQLKLIRGVDQFKACAAQWDQLLAASRCHHANLQAELLASFVEAFSDGRPMVVVCVCDGDRWVAAFPLLLSRQAGVISTAETPNNCWSMGKTLLLNQQDVAQENSDHGDKTHQIFSLIAEGFVQLGSPLLIMDWISGEDDANRRFIKWAEEQAFSVELVTRYQSGKTILKSSWEQYTSEWSRSRRRFVRKSESNLQEKGKTELVAAHELSLDEAMGLFDQCLAMEVRGWKGQSSTAISQTPAAERYYRDKIRILHKHQSLLFYVLQVDGKSIAFDLGYKKNRVATSLKISYDPDYAAYSPGHVLNAFVIREMIAGGEIDWIDTIGELTPATKRWCQESYPCIRVRIATRGWLNHRLVQASGWLRTIKSVAQSMKKRPATATESNEE